MRDITDAVERLAPPSLAGDWDNCGLQVGDPAAKASRVLVALTPMGEVFEEAEEAGADFLLFHHPLIFGPLESVDTGSYPGDLIARAIRRDLAVYAAHTSYDAAPDGVSVALAEALGVRGPLRVVSPRGALRKLVIFVPEENVDAVAGALADAGAGVIGEYTHCTFRAPGTGTFLGGEATDPYLGERGRLEKVEEIRLETVVPAHAADRAVADDFLAWLLATDRYGHPFAMARRLGIMYMIHNRRIWSAYRWMDGWRPYTGASPHTDHVHFSFSWAGANRATTWWTAPGAPPAPPPPAPMPTGDFAPPA